MGLGAVWNNDMYYIAEEIQTEYNVPHDFMLAVCIGHPKEPVTQNIPRAKKYHIIE
jgi:hypothetical protein